MTSKKQTASALTRLDRVTKNRAELGPLADFYRAAIPVLFDAPPLATVNCPPEVTGPVPWLRAAGVTIDRDALRRQWLSLGAVVEGHQSGEASQQLIQATRAGRIDVADLLSDVLTQGFSASERRLRTLGLSVELGHTLLRLSCLSSLARLVEELEQRMHRWPDVETAKCPWCGSPPLLAELRGMDQQRWLRCGSCAGQWPVDRLCCPYCGQRDHRQLEELLVDGDEERYRLSVCVACRGSVPTLATLSRLSAPELLVAELEVLHLAFLTAGGR